MPRAPRIEYEDAAYHVMARGNRRHPIVYSDADREVFAETLAEAADLAKFRSYAWVLKDNYRTSTDPGPSVGREPRG
ncbi:MAG: hypothetical protein JNJ70_19215 [Verrucomicrobiales bacterium]|nr:hypothetical protein [Verrucomicrobiales bacterium]